MDATVCPHDTAKGLTGWIEFFVVLGAVSGEEIGFLPAQDFPEFYRLWPQVDLVYANPLDALKLEEEHGFLPLAGNDRYDEVVFLVGEGVPPSLESFGGARVGTVPDTFAALLGQELLRKSGVRPGELVPFGSWGEVLSALRAGRITHAFLYRDYYEGLSPVSLEGTTPVLVSETRRFSHVFLLSPRQAGKKEALLSALLALPEHPMGRPVLEELRISRFYPVDSTQAVRELVTGG
jgi:ABC-type amino acid transport substrate-binding protein